MAAIDPLQIEVKLSEEVRTLFQEALSEERIRQIARDEIAKALKEELSHRRFGQPVETWPPYERKENRHQGGPA